MSKVKISEDFYEVRFKLLNKTATTIRIEIDGKEHRFLKSQVDFREWSEIIGIPAWLGVDRGIL